jgi:hypothetical protein
MIKVACDEYIWETCLKAVEIEYKLGIPIVTITDMGLFEILVPMFAIQTSKPLINDSYVFFQDMLGPILIFKKEDEIIFYHKSGMRHLCVDNEIFVLTHKEYFENQEKYWVEYGDLEIFITTLT